MCENNLEESVDYVNRDFNHIIEVNLDEILNGETTVIVNKERIKGKNFNVRS